MTPEPQVLLERVILVLSVLGCAATVGGTRRG